MATNKNEKIKKLMLTKETIQNLRVRTMVKTGPAYTTGNGQAYCVSAPVYR